jgi:hypothetical protein
MNSLVTLFNSPLLDHIFDSEPLSESPAPTQSHASDSEAWFQDKFKLFLIVVSHGEKRLKLCETDFRHG